MSGGVDSSVAAFILKKQGYDCVGVFIRSYNLDGCSEKDANDARRVAEKLQMPFYVWNFEEEYKKRVIGYLVDGYRKGITPNPDIMCNREIKFGLFLKKALSMGADYVATGHYVFKKSRKPKSVSAVESKSEKFFLYEAKDKNKDQSYFLWAINSEYLKYCLFPLGNYLKSEVREIAKKAELPTAEKKDSQGICFLGKVSLEDFLRNYIPEERGDVFLIDGQKVGEHRGVHFYTIGQRHLNLISQQNKSPNSRPLYVVAKDIKTNTLFVAEGDDHPALYSDEIKLTNLNFFDSEFEKKLYAGKTIKVLARVRYKQPLASAKLMFQKSKGFVLKFDNLVKFVAPGQSAVFYDALNPSKERRRMMLGGGVIKKARNSFALLESKI